MRHRVLLMTLSLVGSGCVADPVQPLAPPDLVPVGARNGPAAPRLVADIVPDSNFASLDPQMASTCPGTVTSEYAVLFAHSGCLIVTPTGSAYALTDDLAFETKTRKTSILAMRLTGQDVIGEGGIMHDTDYWQYDPPVTASPTGFVVHVHRDRVPVYRLSGHLNGRRVGTIGTIAIGDIVYRAAP